MRSKKLRADFQGPPSKKLDGDLRKAGSDPSCQSVRSCCSTSNSEVTFSGLRSATSSRAKHGPKGE